MGSDFLRLNGKKVLIDEPDLIGIGSKQYPDNDILTYKQLSELVKEPEDKLRQKDCFILFGNNYKSRLASTRITIKQDEHRAKTQQVLDELKAELNREAERHPDDAQYYHDWADRISPVDYSSMPSSLATEICDYSDPKLESLLYSDPCPPVQTEWLKLPAEQCAPAGFCPTTLRCLLHDVVIDKMIPEFIGHQLEDLLAYRGFLAISASSYDGASYKS